VPIRENIDRLARFSTILVSPLKSGKKANPKAAFNLVQLHLSEHVKISLLGFTVDTILSPNIIIKLPISMDATEA
jgi:hypothetical protein